MNPSLEEQMDYEHLKVQPKQPPKYINEYFIQQTLEVYYRCNVVLRKCRFYCATRPGETYSSEIYRVLVLFTLYNRRKNGILCKPSTHEMSLIVKDVKMSFKRKEGSNEFMMHKYILSRLMGKLMAIYPDEYSMEVVNDHERVCKVSADCLLCFREKYEVYVLEDLTRMSFCQPNRFDGLDLIESQYVMKKLAHIHAASMVYLWQHPRAAGIFLPSPLADGIAPSSYLGVSTFEGMRYAIEMVKRWPGFRDIAERMRSTMEQFNRRLTEVMAHKRCAFKVLVHGEPWAKNIFMKYAQRGSDLSPRDATFVDFQMTFIGSCGYDLNYFLQTSVDFNVLVHDRKTLIEWYHKQLTRTLIKLNYPIEKIPTMTMILHELWHFEFIGYYALLVQLPIACMDEDTTTDFRLKCILNKSERKKFFDIIYSYERVQVMLYYGLRRFAVMGLI
uniref:CHK kinase-like domain-containing protein n=1 Tax=Ceratitis capitata TaxID=7213 RepID=W8CEJ5_CERCA